MNGIYLKIYNAAKPYLNTRDNDIHTNVCYSFAVKLLKAEGGQEQVVFPAIILHDVGWSRIPQELHNKAFGPGKHKDKKLNRIHEVEGAKIAKKILRDINYDQSLIEKITDIVLGHDSRKDPLSLDDAIVKDSDKLWRFSDVGMRVSMKRFELDASSYIRYLESQIHKWFFTKYGRRIAEQELHFRRMSPLT
ncbi:MAG: HD domain-containing protein [Deltaproteobacteria bacterium]|nr:HD domain-containing protein [Deltaproteobacteria bacterium]